MEDLADALKRQYLGLYKKKNDIFGTVQERIETHKERRRSNRRQEMFEKRKIPVDMSPIVTPAPKTQKVTQKKAKDVKAEPPANNKRLEMLLKWKADKERRTATDKKNAKPIFKVCHIPVSVGLPNLANVNKEIKGKTFKSKFAPENHQFRPPASVKPIPLPKPPNSATSKQKKKTETTPAIHQMVTRSRSVPSVKSVEKPRTKPVKKTESIKKKVQTKESKDKHDVKSRKSETSDDGTCSPDYPMERNSSECTPKKTELPPVYVSPFVTMSRGKDSARKEYAARKSGQSFSTEKASAENTSPKTGAVYFRRLLNTQIARLQEVCNQWNEYKDEQSPPEEAVSMIDVAVGQTNLLLTKKFMQFKGLVDQCEDDSGDSRVRCEDLHGFWDMMYIQVESLDKRFENLTNLKANNWQEILPEVKKTAVQKKGKAARSAKASAGLKAAIEAARKRRKEQENGDSLSVRTPQNRRSSHRLDVVKNESNSRKSGSPGLMMMKVAQYAKNIETPAKSILKTDVSKSAKSQTKTVLFKDEIDENVNTENDVNKSNVQTRVKTPKRRSSRLSSSKHF